MMYYLLYFLLWLFFLYWIHVFAHVIPFIKNIHFDHHRYISKNQNVSWHWSNLFLINQTALSTIDLWITEVIPTILFSLITGQWWISVFYYLWAALLQETLEHNNNFDLPLLTSGKWHLLHHSDVHKNFSLFFPLWDIIFKTYKKL
jgi:sterol desaturase/sphingolipid hydroxylase (fatty acid hydroxylase superfamily)